MILLDHKKNPLVLIVIKQVNLVVLPVIINYYQSFARN